MVAPSFGDIFRQNCAVNGAAALALSAQAITTLFDLAQVQTLHLDIDLHAAAREWPTHLAPAPDTARTAFVYPRHRSWIAATLAQRDLIAQFESARLSQNPKRAPTRTPECKPSG